MAIEIPEIETFLPYGNALRDLVSQSYISAFELKKTLRQRGIFLNSGDKEHSIPLLMSLILSPAEFESLREKQNTKEDNIKTTSFTIPLSVDSTDTSLLALIPDNLNLNQLIGHEDFRTNFSVDGNPNFQMTSKTNPNRIELPFTTTRDNLTKNWATNKTKHDSTIIVERLVEDNKPILKITQKYTSSETKTVGKEFAKAFTHSLKEQKVVAEDVEPRKILFNDFINEDRIKFLQRLMADVSGSAILELDDITDIELSPDRTAEMPEKLGWLQEKIDSIRLKGKDLFNSEFVQDQLLHKCLLFSGIEATYKFNVMNVSGTCSVTFIFNGFVKSQDVWSELEIRLGSMVFDPGSKGQKKNEYQSKILDYFEQTKFPIYERFRKKLDVVVDTPSVA